MRVGGFRRPAGVDYPNAYASPEAISSCTDEKKKEAMYLFNCAQRAHYNFLENYVAALPALLIAGVKYPRVSAGLGALWCVGRMLYATGYTNPAQKAGKGRYRGALFWPAQFGLFGICGWMGWEMLMN